MIHQKVLSSLVLINAKEVLSFAQDLAELDVFAYGELAGNAAIVRGLWTMNDDFLGRRNIGREKYRGVDLRGGSIVLCARVRTCVCVCVCMYVCHGVLVG